MTTITTITTTTTTITITITITTTTTITITITTTTAAAIITPLLQVQDDSLTAAKMIISLSPATAAHHAPLLLQRVMMILGTAAADAAQMEVL
jgi:hypothetical protein